MTECGCLCLPECDHGHWGCCVEHDVERYDRDREWFRRYGEWQEKQRKRSPGETLRSNDE